MGAGRAAKRKREGFESKDDGDESSTLNVESAVVRPGNGRRVGEDQLAVCGREARREGGRSDSRVVESRRGREARREVGEIQRDVAELLLSKASAREGGGERG